MSEPRPLFYASDPDLTAEVFRAVLVSSGLGAIRPVDDARRLKAMLDGANLIVTARLDEPGRPVVGVLRGVSDGAFSCYVSDIAVNADAQGLGVGRGLLDEARRLLGPEVSLILISLPDVVGFYERAGMKPMPNAFWYKRER